MSKIDASAYTAPRIETLRAGDILEKLGPVSAGSASAAGGGSSCSTADQLLGRNGC